VSFHYLHRRRFRGGKRGKGESSRLRKGGRGRFQRLRSIPTCPGEGEEKRERETPGTYWAQKGEGGKNAEGEGRGGGAPSIFGGSPNPKEEGREGPKNQPGEREGEFSDPLQRELNDLLLTLFLFCPREGKEERRVEQEDEVRGGGGGRRRLLIFSSHCNGWKRKGGGEKKRRRALEKEEKKKVMRILLRERGRGGEEEVEREFPSWRRDGKKGGRRGDENWFEKELSTTTTFCLSSPLSLFKGDGKRGRIREFRRKKAFYLLLLPPRGSAREEGKNKKEKQSHVKEGTVGGALTMSSPPATVKRGREKRKEKKEKAQISWERADDLFTRGKKNEARRERLTDAVIGHDRRRKKKGTKKTAEA